MFALDLIVEERNRDWLDQTMLSFGGLTGTHPTAEGFWPVRVIGRDETEARARAEFLEYIIKQQGYGILHRIEVVEEESHGHETD